MKPVSGKEIINTFIYGCRLDLSITSYITVISVLIYALYLFSKKHFLKQIITTWHFIAVFIVFTLAIADAVVYAHWQTKINPTAISFLKSPGEVMASISSGDHVVVMFILFIVLMIASIKFSSRLLKLSWKREGNTKEIIAFFILLPLLFIGIRGGIQLEPINQSSAFFSNRPVYNHAAINTTWNLLNKYVLLKNQKSNYTIASNEDAEKAARDFYNQSKPSYSISKYPKPNILFIILEGFTADVISDLGGEKGLTSCIDSLIKEGMLWTNFYANGDRTYKGLPAILNGWPTRPIGSVTQDADQTLALPSIAKTLKSTQYHTSFYYGGESEFANIKSYLINTGFDQIIDIKSFPKESRGIKWGVPDQYVFEKLANDLHRYTKPFFSCILTLSSHEPYDIPVAGKFAGSDDITKFRNTVVYTDESLNKCIKQIKDKSWYDSTLIVLTADHGNHLPKRYATNYDPGRFKVPFLLFGPALTDSLKNKKINQIASHNDIAYSILSDLNYDVSDYHFSHQLFTDDISQGAFYTFDNGFGYISSDNKYCYDYTGNKMVYGDRNVSDSIVVRGKMLMQITQKK